MFGIRRPEGHRYRVRDLDVSRTYGPSYFVVPEVLKPGQAIDMLAEKRKQYRVSGRVRVQLERFDRTRGWVRAASESD